jgi:hypothetical protein
MNITLEIIATEGKLLKSPQSATFYSIDNITPVPEGKSAIIMSGGREYIASCSYEELWDKIKRQKDEGTSR